MKPHRWADRYWPVTERWPGESVTDWARRLDAYANREAAPVGRKAAA